MAQRMFGHRDLTSTRRYAKLGDWGGLALWCEMTRHWLESEGPFATDE